MDENLGERSVSFCPVCRDRLSWTRNYGSEFEVWIAICECGVVQVLHVREVVEEYQP